MELCSRGFWVLYVCWPVLSGLETPDFHSELSWATALGVVAELWEALMGLVEFRRRISRGRPLNLKKARWQLPGLPKPQGKAEVKVLGVRN